MASPELPPHGYFGPRDLLAVAREISREVRPSARVSLTRGRPGVSRFRRAPDAILVEDGAARFVISGRTGASRKECSRYLRGVLTRSADFVGSFNIFVLSDQSATDALKHLFDDPRTW